MAIVRGFSVNAIRIAPFGPGDLPTTLDLPTGSGKTSVIVIWLFALAYQAGHAPERVRLPRRIVWVVDRRVVVDQATEEAVRLVSRLSESLVEMADLRRDLHALCVCGGSFEYPLAVSTLRGEREDNREWSENPTRPAIVVGTVDMVGGLRSIDRGLIEIFQAHGSAVPGGEL